MAQRFRTDLVDEIVQGGVKFWRAVNASGSILLDSFRMERANKNTREGSAFGAKEANAIHEFLNGLLDGTETVKNADVASTLTGYTLIKFFKLSSSAFSISDDSTYAWIAINVGKQYVGTYSLVSALMIPGTPYVQTTNVCSGVVDANGVLAVEVKGYGFIPAHSFAFSIALFK